MFTYLITDKKANLPFPVLRRHEPGVQEQVEAGFAEQAARAAFGRGYVHPVDRDFTDRQPSHIIDPPQLEPVTRNPVAAILDRKRRAA